MKELTNTILDWIVEDTNHASFSIFSELDGCSVTQAVLVSGKEQLIIESLAMAMYKDPSLCDVVRKATERLVMLKLSDNSKN